MKPGGHHDRVRMLWELTRIDSEPDEYEQRCLEELDERMLGDEVIGCVRATVNWKHDRLFPRFQGDGFASLSDMALNAAYWPSDEELDPPSADPMSDTYEIREATAAYRAYAGLVASQLEQVQVETLFIHRIEEIEWHEAKPFPTIVVHGGRGATCKFTDFDADAGADFYNALVATAQAQWGTQQDEDLASSARDLVEQASEERGEPPHRLIRTAADAEEAAAAWLRWLGLADARATPVGRDEGVDVVASEAVAQVKAQTAPVGRPYLQALLGAATGVGKRALFFSLGGYTRGAEEFADATEVALFTFDLQGQPEPVNDTALLFAREYLPES